MRMRILTSKMAGCSQMDTPALQKPPESPIYLFDLIAAFSPRSMGPQMASHVQHTGSQGRVSLNLMECCQ